MKKLCKQLALLFDRVIMWFKYRKHPCYLGSKDSEFDHDLESRQDEQGDGVYSVSYNWIECARCGATHDEDASIPECPDDYFDDCDQVNLGANAS